MTKQYGENATISIDHKNKFLKRLRELIGVGHLKQFVGW